MCAAKWSVIFLNGSFRSEKASHRPQRYLVCLWRVELLRYWSSSFSGRYRWRGYLVLCSFTLGHANLHHQTLRWRRWFFFKVRFLLSLPSILCVLSFASLVLDYKYILYVLLVLFFQVIASSSSFVFWT